MKKTIYKELSVDETINRLKEMTCTIQPYRYNDETIYSAIRYLENAKQWLESEVE